MKELVKKALSSIIDGIDAGTSTFTNEEAMEILETINRITQNKLSKAQACKYLGISRSTFDNKVREGLLPQGRKEQGFTEKFWYKSDLDNYGKVGVV